MTPLEMVYVGIAIVATVAALLAFYRIADGPSIMDRTVASDVLTASAFTIVCVMIVWWKRADLGVLLIILALTAFLTAVVVARYIRRDVIDDSASGGRRILTAAEDAERQRRREEEELRAEMEEIDHEVDSAAAEERRKAERRKSEGREGEAREAGRRKAERRRASRLQDEAL